MKKGIAIILTLALALATAACSRGPDARDVAGFYSGVGRISAQTEIGVISGGAIMTYTVDYSRDEQGGHLEILAPESIRGVKADLRSDGQRVSIEYEGAGVETLLPFIPGFSPADGLHGVFLDLALGVPATQGPGRRAGTAGLLLTYESEYEGRQLEKQVWLDRESLAPQACEFFIDGQMMMRLEVVSVSLYTAN